MLSLILFILALACFLVASFVTLSRVNLGWLGAALFTLATLLGSWSGAGVDD